MLAAGARLPPHWDESVASVALAPETNSERRLPSAALTVPRLLGGLGHEVTKAIAVTAGGRVRPGSPFLVPATPNASNPTLVRLVTEHVADGLRRIGTADHQPQLQQVVVQLCDAARPPGPVQDRQQREPEVSAAEVVGPEQELQPSSSLVHAPNGRTGAACGQRAPRPGRRAGFVAVWRSGLPVLRGDRDHQSHQRTTPSGSWYHPGGVPGGLRPPPAPGVVRRAAGRSPSGTASRRRPRRSTAHGRPRTAGSPCTPRRSPCRRGSAWPRG